MSEHPQEQIKRYLQARGVATSVELKAFTWDFRKAICRLKKEGMQIISRPTPGRKYSTYVLYEGQIKLL